MTNLEAAQDLLGHLWLTIHQQQQEIEQLRAALEALGSQVSAAAERAGGDPEPVRIGDLPPHLQATVAADPGPESAANGEGPPMSPSPVAGEAGPPR